MLGFFSSRRRSSTSCMHSSPTLRHSANFSSSVSLGQGEREVLGEVGRATVAGGGGGSNRRRSGGAWWHPLAGCLRLADVAFDGPRAAGSGGSPNQREQPQSHATLAWPSAHSLAGFFSSSKMSWLVSVSCSTCAATSAGAAGAAAPSCCWASVMLLLDAIARDGGSNSHG